MAARTNAPRGLGDSGRRLWRAVVDGCDEIDEHERVLLTRCCRTLDVIDGLQKIVDAEGLITDSSQGARAHPALTEMRQQELKLARLMATLKLDFGAEVAVPMRERKTRFEVMKGA
ncbi:P27 family phage terminase small subunit [Mycobacterium lehmannii]|uniref:P27 family phage terminase small subunit n=1 Tax=Mycobacterium lehmannii TaxID=2048550 RepID=UPI0018E96CB8|nr:P27 family phage terminase small subunit [Mycobacterium lehmannii]